MILPGFDAFITTESGTAVSSSSLKSIDEITREVLRGDWENGAERRNRLIAAGYDYAAVQARVNEFFDSLWKSLYIDLDTPCHFYPLKSPTNLQWSKKNRQHDITRCGNRETVTYVQIYYTGGFQDGQVHL